MNRAVALIPCPSYGPELVQAAVDAAFSAPGAPDMAGKTVLLKPNMVFAAQADRAVSTHPEILRAAIRRAKASGASRVVVGESPGYQGFEAAMRACGLMKVAQEEGVETDDFSRTVEVSIPQEHSAQALVRSFTIAAAAAEADVLVNLPKLKTHSLMQYTGAIKNLFGCVSGLSKAAYHLRFPDKATFGRMLVDLALSIGADFHLMDAVVAMEGPGPGNGYPRAMGLILGSENPLALDRVASRLIGYADPDAIPYLAHARERGAWLGPGEDAIPVDGAGQRIDSAPYIKKDWKLVPGREDVAFLNRIPKFLRPLVKNVASKRPFFSERRCVRCGGCVRICPAAALSFAEWPRDEKFGGRKVAVDYGKCIRCYCCHEICPDDAIDLRRF